MISIKKTTKKNTGILNLDKFKGSFDIDTPNEITKLAKKYPGLVDHDFDDSLFTFDSTEKSGKRMYLNLLKDIIKENDPLDTINPDTDLLFESLDKLEQPDNKNKSLNLEDNLEQLKAQWNKPQKKIRESRPPEPSNGYVIMDFGVSGVGKYIGIGKVNGHTFDGIITQGDWRKIVERETGMLPSKTYPIEVPSWKEPKELAEILRILVTTYSAPVDLKKDRPNIKQIPVLNKLLKLIRPKTDTNKTHTKHYISGNDHTWNNGGSYSYVPHNTMEQILLDYLEKHGEQKEFDIYKKTSTHNILAEKLTVKQYNRILKGIY